MNRTRVGSLLFVLALGAAPIPAVAQGPPPAPGPGSGLQDQVNTLTTRVNTLEAAVSALQTALAAETTNRTAADSTLTSNLSNEASARTTADGTLQTQIDKLNGNITAADLEGAYSFYFVATALDVGGVGPSNILTSYYITGTMTLGAGGTGQVSNSVAAGRQLTERLPGQTWLMGSVGASGLFDGPFTWTYSNGVFTINADGDINNFTPTAGGQVMVSVQGGPPGNNQAIYVLTRKPSN